MPAEQVSQNKLQTSLGRDWFSTWAGLAGTWELALVRTVAMLDTMSSFCLLNHYILHIEINIFKDRNHISNG
jgi:hypothetical protein